MQPSSARVAEFPHHVRKAHMIKLCIAIAQINSGHLSVLILSVLH